MILKTITLQGFRNLTKRSFSFDERRTLIFGENGCGKTSVLEAIFLLGFGKSFLQARRHELVHDGSEQFRVCGEFVGDYGPCVIEAVMGAGFSLRLNEQKCSLLQINEYLYPVFFSSLQYNSYIESRQLLRRLIDRFIFGVQPLYLHYILRYNQALRQKNSLLRRAQPPLTPIELDSWNHVLAESGTRIIRERMNLVEKINKVIREKFASDLQLRYFPTVAAADAASEEGFLSCLQRTRESEIRSRQSLVGPQRDGFEFSLADCKLSRFSSGEKKKYLLLFYFSCIELFRSSRRESPILLIDDFDAAIDEQNLDFLFSRYPDIQVIATSVHADDRFSTRIELQKEN